MADPITSTVSDRICKHMNEDHADAVLLYAQIYGQQAEATTAQMLTIDPQGMNLEVKSRDAIAPIRITFDHTLQDSEDAHQTLIAMIRQARAK